MHTYYTGNYLRHLKGSSDTPSKCEVSGKNKPCKVLIKLIILSTASSPLKFSVAGVEVSIVLQL